MRTEERHKSGRADIQPLQDSSVLVLRWHIQSKLMSYYPAPRFDICTRESRGFSQLDPKSIGFNIQRTPLRETLPIKLISEHCSTVCNTRAGERKRDRAEGFTCSTSLTPSRRQEPSSAKMLQTCETSLSSTTSPRSESTASRRSSAKKSLASQYAQKFAGLSLL